MKVLPTILVLIVACLAVTLDLWFVRGKKPLTRSRDSEQIIQLVPDMPIDEVTRITLKRGLEHTWIFQRTSNGWIQEMPFPHVMDGPALRQLISQSTRLESVKRISVDGGGSDEASLSSMLLDPPQAEVIYDWPDGSVHLQLGRRSLAGRAYLRIAGEDTVHITDQRLHDFVIGMDPREWRDRQIFHGVGVESDRIERVEGDLRLVLHRERKQWHMIEPVQTRLDTLARDELFQALGRAVVDGYVLDEPDQAAIARFGLADAAATISITSTHMVPLEDEFIPETETQRLIVGSTVGIGSMERFALIEGQPTVVRLSVPVLQALFKPIVHLIEPTGCGVQAADVMRLRIIGPEGEFDLKRRLDEWYAPEFGPGGVDVDVPAVRVEELLEQLTELRAPSVEIQDYPRELEVCQIILFSYGLRPLTTVRIAHDPSVGNWAMENGDNVLRIFPPGLKLNLSPEDFGLSRDAQ